MASRARSRTAHTAAVAAPVELVSATTPDGVLLQGALAVPGDARAGVLCVHGAWGNFYSTPPAELLRAAPERGLAALSLNLRSHDLGSAGDGNPFEGFVYHEFGESALDLDTALELLLGTGVQRVVVVAHSYGSHMAVQWLTNASRPSVTGLAVLSPGPLLATSQRWFVDGALQHHVALAAAAVGAGEPDRLLSLGSHGPVPMVASAATVLSAWGPDSRARSDRQVHRLDVPLLVVGGQREPSVYRDYADTVAANAPDGERLVLDDNHYYALDRGRLAAELLDWIARRQLLEP